MPHFPKPTEGSWTEHYPQLGTGPISYEDSISPAFFELEREAIFARTWLNVGRIEQLPRVGSYFTREIDALRASIVVVRAADDELRAFSKEGELTFVQQEAEFFDLDKSDYGLASVRVDTWEGFVFVNFDPSDPTPLRDYLGEIARGLEGYPFGEMTQVYKYRADVHSNWKLYIDAFAEFYHAPVLHAKQYVSDESNKLIGHGFEGLHYALDGPHGMVSSWGGMAPPKDPSMVKPIERILRSGNFGAWDRPDIAGLDQLPPGLNPSRSRTWGLDSHVFFPNFMVLVWATGWYLTYQYWPIAHDRHIFEGTLYFAPAKTARDRLRQEMAAVTFKEFGLQDCNTLEATQTMLATRAVTEFPLCDQEILVRHLHHTAREYVTAYQEERDPPHVARRSGHAAPTTRG